MPLMISVTCRMLPRANPIECEGFFFLPPMRLCESVCLDFVFCGESPEK